MVVLVHVSDSGVVDVVVTSVGVGASGGAGVAVSSDVDVDSSAAIVLEIVAVVGAPMQCRHGPTG